MFLKYALPWYWPSLAWKTITLPVYLLKKAFGLPMWVLRKTKPKNPILKAIWYLAFIWVALPGTIPYSAMVLTGHMEEANAMAVHAYDTAIKMWEVAQAVYPVMMQ